MLVLTSSVATLRGYDSDPNKTYTEDDWYNPSIEKT